MKRKYVYIIAFIGLLLFPIFANAQSKFVVNYKEDADRYFAAGNYYAAAVYYQKALEPLPDEIFYLPYDAYVARGKKQKKDEEKYQYILYRIGQSFRLYNDYESAEKWYKKALKFENDRFPLTKLWYGVTLRAVGKYKEALKELKNFKDNYKGDDKYIHRARLEVASCLYAIGETRYPRLAEVTELPAPITVEKGSNYAPIRIGNTLYFTSSRAINGVDTAKNSPYINKIYTATHLSGSHYSTPERIDLTGELTVEEAVLSMNKRHHRIYFTKWQKAEGEKEQYIIVTSELGKDGKWTTPVPLGTPVNVADANTKEATVTSDGRYLFFSSNRSGGIGGYDLWFCSLDAQGLPTGKAVNLGTAINTRRDERNPYYNVHNNMLVFSSNGKVGIGGFDLYKSKGNLSGNYWSAPKNFGYPVNSSKDDIYYYPLQKKGERFYTSSDRNSVCCLSIYDVQLDSIRLTGHVYDKKFNKPMGNVKVTLTDSISGKEIGEFTTSSNGGFHFSLDSRRPLNLTFTDIEVKTKEVGVSNTQLGKVDSVYNQDVYLTFYGLHNSFILENAYFNFDKSKILPKAKPGLDSLVDLVQSHPEWVIQIGSYTDSVGTDTYNVALSQRRSQAVVDYLIAHGVSSSRVSARGFGEADPIASNSKPDGSDNPSGRKLNRRSEFTILDSIVTNEGNKEIDTVLKSVIDRSNIAEIRSDPKKYFDERAYRMKKEKEKGPQLSQYEMNDSIQLGTIYYDYNQFILRFESRKILDSAAQILKNNPNLMMQINSFIGNNETYNKGLSQRRTWSCIVYLTNSSVPKNRIINMYDSGKKLGNSIKSIQKSSFRNGYRLSRCTVITFWEKK